MTALKPVSTGFLDVNGIKLWHEIYGQGEPLVLLPGGLMAIEEMMAIAAPLAKHRQVVALELQGHGHSADTDRPLSFETSGDDVAAVIAALGLARADVVGLSFGGAVGLRAAIQHPDRVRRLVVISSGYARSGWYPEARRGMASVSAALADSMMGTPTGELSRAWPQPDRFPTFLDRMGKLLAQDYDWSAEVERLPMPVMLVYADHDSLSQAHIAEFFALLGGGTTEPGWQNTKFTKARLAVVPGYSHYNFASAPEIGPIVDKFLTAPISGTSTGAAAASAASPMPDKS
jgi:pimeloyl-ACP methyl ester carboxylesterase